MSHFFIFDYQRNAIKYYVVPFLRSTYSPLFFMANYQIRVILEKVPVSWPFSSKCNGVNNIWRLDLLPQHWMNEVLAMPVQHFMGWCFHIVYFWAVFVWISCLVLWKEFGVDKTFPVPLFSQDEARLLVWLVMFHFVYSCIFLYL